MPRRPNHCCPDHVQINYERSYYYPQQGKSQTRNLEEQVYWCIAANRGFLRREHKIRRYVDFSGLGLVQQSAIALGGTPLEGQGGFAVEFILLCIILSSDNTLHCFGV